MTAESTSRFYVSCAAGSSYLDGASKTYAMTGWRLGWSVWPKPLYGLCASSR